MEKNTTYYEGIGDYMKPYLQHFRRPEAGGHAQNYVVGLMMEGERKSAEPLSEKVGDSERNMQRMLRDAKWDEAAVQREYRRQMLSHTRDPQGVLVVDDTAFPKKGNKSVGVTRQYCGATGKIDNCQVGVSLAYVGQTIAWPYAMELYIPESWDNPKDPDCLHKRHMTQMPESAHHQKKWQMALDQIDQARAEGVPHRAVTADAWYGSMPEFRRGLERRHESYVVGVYSSVEVFLEPPAFEQKAAPFQKRKRRSVKGRLAEGSPQPVKIGEIGLSVAEDAWERLELRKGSRGKPLLCEAVSLRVWPAEDYQECEAHEDIWLIIERRRVQQDRVELRYYLSTMPQDMPTIELVRLYHERYWIEQDFQQLKEELGLDHHEGRSWTGWHRHVLLVFLAFGYLVQVRIREKKQQKQEGWRNWTIHRRSVHAALFM